MRISCTTENCGSVFTVVYTDHGWSISK